MAKYRFDQVSGYKAALIEAESFDEAIDKFGGVDDRIPAYKRFDKHYHGGLYTVKKEGDPNPQYVVHSTRVLD